MLRKLLRKYRIAKKWRKRSHKNFIAILPVSRIVRMHLNEGVLPEEVVLLGTTRHTRRYISNTHIYDVDDDVIRIYRRNK